MGWVKHYYRILRVLFHQGAHGASAYQYFGRELTEAELAELDGWFKGVNRAMDDVNKELGKMPSFPIRGKRNHET